MENQVRDKNRITGHKKQERMNINKGNPSVRDVIQGVPSIWMIPNSGLFMVINYNNKLYYNEFIEEE